MNKACMFYILLLISTGFVLIAGALIGIERDTIIIAATFMGCLAIAASGSYTMSYEGGKG
jgi:hypothetical protein